jgi:predicted amidohydrolase YtcJ
MKAAHHPHESIDTIISGGALFNGKQYFPGSWGVALSGNTISRVGPVREIESLGGPDTKRISGEGGLILPGFHDFHIHLYAGSLTQEGVDLHHAASAHEAAQTAGDFARQHPDHTWVLGFNWYHIFWNDKTLPDRKLLDRFIPDRPAFLFNAEYHGAWVNTRALELCGITAATPDPPFGRIERDAKGEPTGILYETALGPAGVKAVDRTKQQKERLFSSFLETAACNGVTSVNDMLPLPGMQCGDPDVYHQFEQRGDLTARIYLEANLRDDLSDAAAMRERYASPLLSFAGLKQFVDGVATTYTAYLLEPYSDNPKTRGEPLIPPDTLKKLVADAARNGFRTRLHACGDGAVRLCLDCYEHAVESGGSVPLRHTIEHLETVHTSDIPRFAKLGVIASIQPEHLAMTEQFADTPYLGRMGKHREMHLWPNNSLVTSGAQVCYGSDWPVVALNPLHGIYRAVTRVHNDGKPENGWNPAERVDRITALRNYTAGGAYGVSREAQLGTLEEGYLADIVVLDRDIVAGGPEEILEASVRITISDGRVVYER